MQKNLKTVCEIRSVSDFQKSCALAAFRGEKKKQGEETQASLT